MTDAIRYEIEPSDPQAHLFRITVTVPDPDPAGQVLSMPAWTPGSYMIRDFARHVVRLWAEADGQSVAVFKRDKATWQCTPCDGPLNLTYEVYAFDPSVRAAYLDHIRGFFNGTSVFVIIHGYEDRAVELILRLPTQGTTRGWHAVTSMHRAGGEPYTAGRFTAANYLELVDHPFLLGHFDLVRFEAGGVPHEVAVGGRCRLDHDRLADDLKSVCEAHITLFEGDVPFDRYVFLLHVTDSGYGGLEHRASSALIASRQALPPPGQEPGDAAYRQLLGLFSHEYFHAWNVKRIRPAAFDPPDLARECYTEDLWVFEGITSYYDGLALVRSGAIDTKAYLELLGRTITRVLRGTGRLKQSVADSSFDAWTRFYKQDENAPNAIVSYYAKGALIALALDLTLRRDTDGTCTLDDIMKTLWSRYGRPEVGLPEGAVEAVAQSLSGLDLRPFFERYLRGTDDPPLGELLDQMGVTLHARPVSGSDDAGGRPASVSEEALARQPALGARFKGENGEVRITAVPDGGAAQRAGLAPGDRLIAVDGVRIRPGDLDRRLAGYPLGGTVPVHFFRDAELLTVDLPLWAPPADIYYLTLNPEPDSATMRRLRAWLGTGAGAEAT